MRNETVLQCPGCGKKLTLLDFLENSSLEPIGISVGFDAREDFALYFKHNSGPDCPVIAVPLQRFDPLIDREQLMFAGTMDPLCQQRLSGPPDFGMCSTRCTYGPYCRLLLKMLRNRETRFLNPHRCNLPDDNARPMRTRQELHRRLAAPNDWILDQ